MATFERPGHAEPLPPPVPARRPVAVTLLLVLVLAYAVLAYVELERRIGDGFTITIGGPGLALAVAVGLACRWRAGWWGGIVMIVASLVFYPVLSRLGTSAFATAIAASGIALLALFLVPSVRVWSLDRTDTTAATGSFFGVLLIASLAASLLVSAT